MYCVWRMRKRNEKKRKKPERVMLKGNKLIIRRSIELALIIEHAMDDTYIFAPKADFGFNYFTLLRNHSIVSNRE